jgi:hypothetical protein
MAARSAWWTRAEALNWIMTRRLTAVSDSTLQDPAAPHSSNDIASRAKDTPTHWAIVDALYRMQVAPAEAALGLPPFADALAELEQAERAGLEADAQGRFRREQIQKQWPSPYGRPSKRGDRRGGVAPKPWKEWPVRVLMLKFMRGPRDMNRDKLKTWVTGEIPPSERHDLNFNDPERWSGYVLRAMDAAAADIQLHLSQGNISESEAAERRRNVASWRADGPIAKRS